MTDDERDAGRFVQVVHPGCAEPALVPVESLDHHRVAGWRPASEVAAEAAEPAGESTEEKAAKPRRKSTTTESTED